MQLSKWKIVLVVIGLLFVIGNVCLYVSTATERKTTAEFDALVDFANRQEVEIAIIKQAVELQRLKMAIRKTQQAKPVKVEVPEEAE